MAVMMPKEPREKWTDERLDDGFVHLDKDIRELRGDLNSQVNGLQTEMNARFDKLNETFNARFDKLNETFNARFDTINARFDAQNRALIGAAAVIVAALIGVNVF